MPERAVKVVKEYEPVERLGYCAQMEQIVGGRSEWVNRGRRRNLQDAKKIAKWDRDRYQVKTRIIEEYYSDGDL